MDIHLISRLYRGRTIIIQPLAVQEAVWAISSNRILINRCNTNNNNKLKISMSAISIWNTTMESSSRANSITKWHRIAAMTWSKSSYKYRSMYEKWRRLLRYHKTPTVPRSLSHRRTQARTRRRPSRRSKSIWRKHKISTRTIFQAIYNITRNITWSTCKSSSTPFMSTCVANT